MKNALKGPALLIVAMFMFAAMGVFVKSAGKQVPFVELVALRCLASVVAIFLLAKREKVSLAGKRRGLLLVRGITGTAALFMFFFALTEIPVADSILLNQTTPVFTLPLAALFLKEKIPLRNVFFVAVVLVGVALVVKPRGDVVNPAAFIALGSAVFAAISYILVRKLTAGDHPLTIVFWFNVVGFFISLPVSAPVFVVPARETVFDIIAMGILGTLGQIFMTYAYRRSEAGKLAALGSFGALFGAFFDYVVLHHLPDALSAVGGLVVIVFCALIQVDFSGRKTARK